MNKSIIDVYHSVVGVVDFSKQYPSITESEYLNVVAIRCGYEGDNRNTRGTNLYNLIKKTFNL